MSGLQFAFIMDPMEKVLPDKDTTLVLMLESQRRGHTLWHVLAEDLRLENGRVAMNTRRVTVRRGTPCYEYHETVEMPAADLDAIWLRTDPPFDMRYYETTLILDRAECDAVVINRPDGVRGANEKLYALRFPEVTPPSVVTADPEQIFSFVKDVGGEAVIKPVDAMGGFGIFRARLGDENLPSLTDYMTNEGRRRVFVQKFIDRVYEGDKRIILLDGEPLGAVLRVPRKGDFRGNIHVGGRVHKTELDDEDRRVIDAVRPRLKADGLWLAGIDVVGGQLTEVNVTSPTGVQEINHLNGTTIETHVIDFAEAKVAERRG